MKISKELKIGIFVVLVLVMSFLVINFLRQKDLFNRDLDISARYGNIQGLTVSAPVSIKGYKAGAVSDITYDAGTGTFIVTCSVRKYFNLPEDTRMVIYSADIMGSKGVELVPGTSDVLLEDGAEIQGEIRTDLLESLKGDIVPLVGKVSAAVDSLNVTVGNINRALDDENLAGITSAIRHLDRTMANVEHISSVLDGRSEEIDALLANLGSMSSTLTSVVEKADSAMTDIGGVAATLNESDIEGLVSSFRSLLASIQDPDGTIGKLITDGKVYDSFESLLSDIDSLVKKIEENPKKYIRISVF